MLSCLPFRKLLTGPENLTSGFLVVYSSIMSGQKAELGIGLQGDLLSIPSAKSMALELVKDGAVNVVKYPLEHPHAVIGLVLGAVIPLVTFGRVDAQGGQPQSGNEGILEAVGSTLSSIAEYSTKNPLRFYAAAATTGALYGTGQVGYWLLTKGLGRAAKEAENVKKKATAAIRKDGGSGNGISEEAKRDILTGIELSQKVGLIKEDTPEEEVAALQQVFYQLHVRNNPPKKEKPFKEELLEQLRVIPRETAQWLTAAVLMSNALRVASPAITSVATHTISEAALAKWVESAVLAISVIQAVLPEGINFGINFGGKKK
jgi:hypothetical protein